MNLLDTAPDTMPRFNTKNWIEVHNQSAGTCNTSKQVRFKTTMLESDPCDYSDNYFVVKGTITIAGEENKDRKNRDLILKNNTPFIYCISNINGSLTDKEEDLNVMITMYRLIECSKNYSDIRQFMELLQRGNKR